MATVENISKNQTFKADNTKKNQFQTTNIKPIFQVSDKPKSILEVKNKQDVADLTGIDISLLNKIIDFEGLKLKKYKDATTYSIGIGHNIAKDPTYSYGNTITEEQAYKLFAKDLMKVKNDIKECIGDKELKKEQYEALVELFFNVGVENIQGSNLIKLIKNNQLDEAAGEFNFICSGGKANPSLCIRRMYDIERFSTGRHSQQGLNAMEQIMEKGKNFFNDPKRANMATTDKSYYIDETKKLLNQAQKETEAERKEQEKSMFKPITPIFKPIPTQCSQLILKLK